MLFKCYRAYSKDYTAEQLDRILYYLQDRGKGWFSVGIGSVDIYMLDRDWMLFLFEYPLLERVTWLDYMA